MAGDKGYSASIGRHMSVFVIAGLTMIPAVGRMPDRAIRLSDGGRVRAQPDGAASRSTRCGSSGHLAGRMIQAVTALTLLIASLPIFAAVPAFPGAEGFGAGAIGGRGGKVVFVTSLADSGAGSLREALSLSGPRIVVFKVAGTITLKSQLVIANPFVTIAGQSAPGGGITLRMAETANGPALRISTHDVVARFIRVRRGRPSSSSCCDDGISITSAKEKVYNVILDHCSLSWATDELLETWNEAENITIQWSILSESLASLATTTPWGKGLISGDRSRNISIHHNLFANNIQRNPFFNLQVSDIANFEITNNVVYNWAHAALTFQASQENTQLRANVVGNLFMPGPQYADGRYAISIRDAKIAPASLFVSDNIGPYRETGEKDDWAVVGIHSEGALYMKVPAPDAFRARQKWAAPAYPISETPSHQLLGILLQKTGAVFPYRDAVDQRAVSQVGSNEGKIVADPRDVGGWPTLPSGTAPADTDNDGLPNEWEKTYGTDPNANDAALDKDGDGYTNIEEYLNSLVEDYYSDIKRPDGLHGSTTAS